MGEYRIIIERYEIHLSDGNSNAEQFRQGIKEATGKTVHIAQAGLTINFNKTPF